METTKGMKDRVSEVYIINYHLSGKVGFADQSDDGRWKEADYDKDEKLEFKAGSDIDAQDKAEYALIKHLRSYGSQVDLVVTNMSIMSKKKVVTFRSVSPSKQGEIRVTTPQ